MFSRRKTELEMSETPELEASRLREALFIIAGLGDVEEIKRVAKCAMAGEKHGHEYVAPPLPDWMANSVER